MQSGSLGLAFRSTGLAVWCDVRWNLHRHYMEALGWKAEGAGASPLPVVV